MKIRIAILSGLALAVGSWLAPRTAQTTLTVPQEHAAPLLEEQVQLREAGRTFVGVQDVALQVKGHSISIPARLPVVPRSRNDFSDPASTVPDVAGFGVFVTDIYVLTHSAALDGRSSVQLSVAPGATIEARLAAYDPPTGLVLLETVPLGRQQVRMTEADPAPGALAVGVGRTDRRDIAVPIFVTGVGSGRYTVGTINDAILPGMPIFNLAGELFAIAAPNGREVHAIPAKSAADQLIGRVSSGERRSSFGLGFQALSGPLTRAFGERGVVVTEVLEGGPADLGGVQVGDVLLMVGDTEVDSVDIAGEALSSGTAGTPARLRIRRAGRSRDVDVVPALAYEVAVLARAGGDGPSGPEARVILPAGVLERAAILPSAQVLSINGRALSSRAQAQRELRTGRNPIPVLLRHGSSRYFVAIEPER